MKVRVDWRPGAHVRVTADIPHGRGFRKVGATAAELGDPDAAAKQALTQMFEEVAKVVPSARRWVSEGEST